MADGYDDLFELGLEGLDRLTNKYHDKVFQLADRRHSVTDTKKETKHKATERRDSALEQQQQQQQQEDNERRRRRVNFSTPANTYAPDRRREDEREVYAGVRDEGSRYHAAPSGSIVPARGREIYEYPGDYELAPRARSPPQVEYEAGRHDGVYDEKREVERRRPLPPHRRGSSYSPPRRHEHRYRREGEGERERRRRRSRSPNHHRVAATVVGAIAGGLITNRVSKGDGLTTVAGAVVGGLGARQAEKMYEQHKHREMEDEEEQQQRWERRQREREREHEQRRR